MIRRLLPVLLLTCCLFAIPLTASAFDPFPKGPELIDCSGTEANTAICATPEADPSGPNGIIISVAHIVTFVAGALAVILIVYGAIKYVTANGDAGGIKSAKHTVVYSLVGLAVIILAQTIINYVILRL